MESINTCAHSGLYESYATDRDGGNHAVQHFQEHDQAFAEETGAKGRIIRGAIRLFCERGYAATSVREIVAAAGVTKPVLYYYFESKEALLHYIIKQTMDYYRAKVYAIITDASLDAVEKLRAITRMYLENARRDPVLVRFVNSAIYSGMHAEVYDFTSNQKEIHRWLTAMFRQGQEEGLFRKDVASPAMAGHFLAMVNMTVGVSMHESLRLKNIPFEENLLKILLDGTRTEAAREEVVS
ncbi:TetR/AcrR family transcriptional regulator [Candidatus Sumerlaeota bacterium]|nr:TetR/AcrR family transcriptional regulator [Candidatus Sumerlaeota bacterium]